MQNKTKYIISMHFALFFFFCFTWGEVHENENPYMFRIIEEVDEDSFDTPIESQAHRFFEKVIVVTRITLFVTINIWYVSTAIEKVQLSVIHEPHKNIKQLPRCSIDNRTHVRYNRIIATLVRAVMGGTENGRIQKVNNRYGHCIG